LAMFEGGSKESLFYVAMALINLTIGCAHIQILSIVTQGDAGQSIDTASALVGKDGELYYYRTWGYPYFSY